jgi:hypothetical protein
MASIPIKTNDLVLYNGENYIVKSVKITDAGPVLEISPIAKSDIVVHGSEVTLADPSEKNYRAKSLGLYTSQSAKSTLLDVPNGLTKQQSERILARYMRE